MRNILTDLSDHLSDPDPVKRAQIAMKAPLPKRFYKEVTVGGEGDRWTILLDGRTVKTPAKATLEVPNRAVAQLLAEEWDAQATVIDPIKMPLTRLVNTALDGIATDPQAVHEDILRFSSSDLLCYRADSPKELVSLQGDKWDPVMDWAYNVLGARFILVEGIMHQEQPCEATAAFAVTLRKYDHAIDLASLHTITTLTGSAILAVAFAEGFLTADEAWELAHVDENYQAGLWGQDDEAILRMTKRKIEMDAAARLFTAMRDK
ncbi:ATP12 family chaperone protein [Rhizobium sp. L1K21]|uniref:ATP12 family chaperone protein n=1 Tax=Rhizobium sp. L1K21 TaxID=2954933 RepID=UPI0020920C67|nr:ATP12 family chaperone protein [Rhizobium sp. L1K21]MCO6186166.1 ATP12 family chaperone protein [Rhizobium sp. L1K21]